MEAKININNVIQAVSIALLCWCGSTLYKLDKQSELVEWRISAIEKETYHTDCAYCNHELHGKLDKKGRR